MSRIRLGILLAALAAAVTPVAASAAAGSCAAESGANRVAVLELYTSEGCSSCPPADEWVSALPASGFGADQVIPLAFHVDYWNYLGWRDRFSDPAYTERQRQVSASNRIGFVYTPALVLNGKVFRGLSNRGLREALAVINAEPSPVALAMRTTRVAGGVTLEVDATLRDGALAADAVVFVALTQNGLSTEVQRGENAGRKLRHDFVVRAWHGPYPLREGGAARVSQRVATAEATGPAGANLVALVQNRRTGEVLQALALPLCPPS